MRKIFNNDAGVNCSLAPLKVGLIKNNYIDEKEFFRMREAVLALWPSGAEVNLEEAIEYQKSIKEEKRFSTALDSAISEGRTLIQPRAGVALVNEQISLLKYLEEEGGADLLPTTVDSYTRQNKYQEAESGIEESRSAGRSLLNGYPVINHGVKESRRVTEAVTRPIQVRHGTPDARLLAEISLASGFTAFEGAGISYNIPYTKDIPLESSVGYWQYVDRLVGLYEERGVTINREPFGPLTGTLVPPCLSHSIAVIEALLAAEQGVKNISVGYGQCGNLIQDVAAVQTLSEITKEYLGKFDYKKVKVSTAFHQWMGGFPPDEAKAFAVISWGAVTAALSGATKVIVKTPHEAFGVPTKEANADGLKASRQMLNMLQDQSLTNSKSLKEEKSIITAETKLILDSVYELGEGDWAIGVVKAFAVGILDVPFAPSRFNRGKVMPVRDEYGAVRFLDFGNLPLAREIKDYHREKLNIRAKKEHRTVSFQMVIDDIYAIGKGMLVGRPK